MFILGILMGLYLQISIAFLCFMCLCISILIYIFIKKRAWCILLIIMLIGNMYVRFLNEEYESRSNNLQTISTNQYANAKDNDYSQQISNDDNNEVKLRAIIVSEPKEKEYKYTYTIKVEEITFPGDGQLSGSSEILKRDETNVDMKNVETNEASFENILLLLNLKKSNNLKEIPQYGDEILITGNIEKPNGARNYMGFDYKSYLKSKKIYGTIETKEVEILSKNNVNMFETLINKIQKNIKNNITNILGEEEAALCIGILIGEREAISEEVENDFKRSNLTHMLAVSGSHITYIITALANLLSKTGKKFTKIFTIVFLLFFMALTGFTASVMRASIMGILVLMASLLNRKPDTINNLGISAFIILLINPFTLIDVGFLLSYGGTIGIVILNDKINKNKNSKNNRLLNYLVSSFSITLSANIIIIPIMAYFFSTISFTFWISNILAAPIMELTTILGFLVYFVSVIFIPFAKFLGLILNIFLNILLKIAEFSSIIPGSSIYIKTPTIFGCIFFYIIIYMILNYRKIKIIRSLKNISNKKIGKSRNNVFIIAIIFVIVLLISCNLISINSLQELKIYFVDVGQGDCTLIETPTKKHILIDGGGSEVGSFDVGESTLLPYLLDRRITTIDYMLISHFDSDHIGGLFYVMENIKVKNVIISKQGENSENLTKFINIVKEKKIKVMIVEKGDIVQIDKYSYFEILFPEEDLIKENILNNNSIVAKFNCLNLRMLFTGDIEEIAEERLEELYNDTNKLNADILKVAHHGSKTSSTSKFLELVNPQIALIGVGENNNFGHPNNGVIDRMEKLRH